MHRLRNKFGVLFLLLTLAALSSVFATKSDRAKNKNDKVAAAIKRDLVQQVTVAGNVFPLRRTMISPPYNAYVKKLFVQIGQTVKPGDPIVSLAQSLREIGEGAYPLRAPFPGTVVQVGKTEGEYVEMNKDGTTLVRIDDLSRLFVRAQVPESSVPNIKKGLDVIIRVNGLPTKQYKGQIRTIALAATEKQGWGRNGDRVDFDVEAEILDKDDQVLPGMSTIIDIITEKKTQVLSLPLEFVQKRESDFFVTTEKGAEKKVEVGLQNDQYFEILSGINENERVKMVDFYSLPSGKF